MSFSSRPFSEGRKKLFDRVASLESLSISLNSFTAIGDDETFANSVDPDETAHNEPSHQDLCCLTFLISTLHINYFSIDSLLKIKADDQCHLKFGAERVKVSEYTVKSQ